MGKPFNLTSFNTGGSRPRYTTSYAMAQKFEANSDPRVMLSTGYIFNQSFDAEAPLGWGYDIRYVFSQELEADASMETAWSPRYAMQQNIESEANIALHIVPQAVFSQSFDAISRLSIMSFCKQEMSQSIYAESNAAVWVCPAYGIIYQPFHSEITAVPVVIRETMIDVTIPPGGTLVIDTDNYTAYLDNVSVIDRVSGEWLSVRRPTIKMAVTGGVSGNLNVMAMYREMFL